MAITALPTPPSRSDPATFAARGDAFLGALPTFVTEANDLTATVNGLLTSTQASAAAASGSAVSAAGSSSSATASATAAAASAASALNSPSTAGTSTTSIAMATGTIALVTQSGKAWAPGQPVIVAVTVSPTVRMLATVVSYASTTLTVEVGAIEGSGTFAAWTISLGAVTSPLPTRTGQHGKVAVVDGAAVAWNYAERAAPIPTNYHGVLTNLALRSDTCDTALTEWTLAGSLSRIGQEAGRRGNANGATIYSAGIGSSYITQDYTGLTAGRWYALSCYARLVSGTAPTLGTLMAFDRDVDGTGGTVERTSTDFSGLAAEFKRFEMPVYVAGTTGTLYLIGDSQNGAQIAICDVQLNAGRRATTYCTSAGTPAAALPTPTTTRLSNGSMLSGWSSAGTGAATMTLLPDGKMTPDGRLAVRLTETNAVSAWYRVSRSTFTLTSGATYVVRALVCADSLSKAYLLLAGGSISATQLAYFDLATGQVGGLANVRKAWMERVDDSWWMLYMLTEAATSTATSTVYAGATSVANNGAHIGVAGAGLYFGGIGIAASAGEAVNLVDLSSGAVSIGNASLTTRTVHHVTTSEGSIDLLLPPPFAHEWLEVKDVGRSASINRIRLLRGVASAIEGLAEDLDINIDGASVKLRADTEKGWVLA